MCASFLVTRLSMLESKIGKSVGKVLCSLHGTSPTLTHTVTRDMRTEGQLNQAGQKPILVTVSGLPGIMAGPKPQVGPSASLVLHLQWFLFCFFVKMLIQKFLLAYFSTQ